MIPGDLNVHLVVVECWMPMVGKNQKKKDVWKSVSILLGEAVVVYHQQNEVGERSSGEVEEEERKKKKKFELSSCCASCHGSYSEVVEGLTVNSWAGGSDWKSDGEKNRHYQ